MTDPQDDKLIKIYQHSRHEQPSVAMDKKIRHAAEQALYRKRKRWLWGLSTAAVIVISFNVVLQLMLEETAEDEVVMRDELSKPGSPMATAPRSVEMDDNATLQRIDSDDTTSVFSEESEITTPAAGLQVDKMISPAREREQAESARIDFSEVLKERSFDVPDKEARNKTEMTQLQASKEKKRIKASTLPIIPDLPSTLDGLLSINKQLVGEQSVSGLITLYHRDKLVLTVKPGAELIQFKAWPGSSILGIKMDWSVKPVQSAGCIKGPVYQVCDLNKQVKAMFEEDRLDHVLWNKPRD